MNAKAKIASSTIILGTRITTMVSKLVLSIFIARFLGLDQLGIYGMIAGAAALVPVFFRFGIMNSICRDAVSDPPAVLAANLRNYLKLIATLYVALFAVAFGYGLGIGNAKFLVLITGVFIAEHITQDLYNLANNLRMPRRANVIIFASSGLWSLAYMATAILFEPARSIEAVLLFWLAGLVPAISIALHFLLPLPWRTITSGTQSFRSWFSAKFRKSQMLFIGECANNASFYLDRYLIAIFLDLKTAGIYILFWQVGSAVYNLVNAGSMQIFSPLLISALDQEDAQVYEKTFKACITWTAGQAITIAILAAIVFPYILPLTGNPEATTFLSLLYVVLLGQLIRISSDVIGLRLHTKRKDKRMMASYVALCLLTAIFTILGIQMLGVYGAALATSITYICISLLRWQLGKQPK